MNTLMTPEELKAHALSFLQKEKLMVLGTSLQDQVWSATVYFVITDEFEIIFYSRPDTRHIDNLRQNPNVSAVITSSSKKNKSIQVSGVARSADGIEWNTYFPLYQAFMNKHGKHPERHQDRIVYVIKPREVWFIDEVLLGHYNRVRVI